MLGVQLSPLLSACGGLLVNEFHEVRHLLMWLTRCVFSCCQVELRPFSC